MITPDFRVHCGGGQSFYGRYFKCWKKGGHGTVDLRHAIEQSCNVYFYTVGNMLGVDRIHKWATALGLGVNRTASTCRTRCRAWCRRPSGSARSRKEKKWYPGETISVSIGQGQVSVTPISLAVDDGDGRQRRHARHAAPASRRWTTGKGWKPVPPPPPQSHVRMKASTRWRRCATACGWSVNGAGTGGRARDRRARRLRQDRHRAGHLARPGAQRAARQDRTCATTAGSSSSRRATTRRSPASSSPSTATTAPTPRSIAKHIIETYFAKKEGRPLPRWSSRRAEQMRLDRQAGRRSGARPPGGSGSA